MVYKDVVPRRFRHPHRLCRLRADHDRLCSGARPGFGCGGWKAEREVFRETRQRVRWVVRHGGAGVGGDCSLLPVLHRRHHRAPPRGPARGTEPCADDRVGGGVLVHGDLRGLPDVRSLVWLPRRGSVLSDQGDEGGGAGAALRRSPPVDVLLRGGHLRAQQRIPQLGPPAGRCPQASGKPRPPPPHRYARQTGRVLGAEPPRCPRLCNPCLRRRHRVYGVGGAPSDPAGLYHALQYHVGARGAF